MAFARLLLSVFLCATLGISSALATDCGKARTLAEKTICAHPQALEADEKMARAYFALREKLSPKGRKILLTSQRAWLKWRDFSCASEWHCYADKSREHAEFLRATPQGMVPVMRAQLPGKGRALTEVFAACYIFISPGTAGEIRYNEFVRKNVRDLPFGDTYKPENYSINDHPWVISRMKMGRVDERVISAIEYLSFYEGGAHGLQTAKTVNFSRADGRKLMVPKMFSDDALRGVLFEECVAQIAQRKAAEEEEYKTDAVRKVLREYGKDILTFMKDAEIWLLTPAGAEIYFEPYAVGPYAAGFYVCRFPAGQLRALALPPYKGLF